MKHRPSTSKKFYIMHWQNREAIRYSMKCYTSFLSNTNIKNYALEREELLKKPMPTKARIKSHTKEKIKNMFGESITDPGLDACVDELSNSGIEGYFTT